MTGEREYGQCACGKEGFLERKYSRFKCDCHKEEHFKINYTCDECRIDGLDLLKQRDIDSRRWATAFCQASGYDDIEMAHGWFANAMMTMHDEMVERTEQRVVEDVIADINTIYAGVDFGSADNKMLWRDYFNTYIKELKQKYGIKE